MLLSSAPGLRVAPAAAAAARQALLPTTTPALCVRCGLVGRSRGALVAAQAVEKGTEKAQGLDPYLEAAVPRDQRPIEQLAELKGDPLYSWVRAVHHSALKGRGAHGPAAPPSHIGPPACAAPVFYGTWHMR